MRRFLQAIVASGALCACADAPVEFGPSDRKAVIERHYETPDASPIWFGCESKAVNAYAKEYCLYTDIAHSDGTFTYKVLAVFSEGHALSDSALT